MAKHHPDLVMCRKQPGIGTSFVCPLCLLRTFDYMCLTFQLLDVSVRSVSSHRPENSFTSFSQATENVLFVIHMYGLIQSYASAMSAIMGPTKDVASFAEVLAYQMLTTAGNVLNKRKM